ncbi:MAG: hypothetical protein R3D84_02355 [Paracoccaceae bacterium]
MPVANRLTATIAAAAIALSGVTAAPARADSNDLIKLVLGAAVIYGIAKEVDRRNDKKKARNHARYDPKPDSAAIQRKIDRAARYCAVDVRDHRGVTTYYDKQCLRRAGITRRLPAYCEYDLRLTKGTSRVYDGQCLREAGLKIGAGR